jgi:hypothetical protein
MKSIPEGVIDAILDELGDSEELANQHMDRFSEKQPVLMAYLCSEDFDVLSEEEHSYMLFLAMVVWMAVERQNPDQAEIDEDFIGDMDEHNWEIINSRASMPIADRLESFIGEDSPEELIEFLIDAILEEDEDEEEEELIAPEAIEPIFVALKTVVDVLTKEQ